MPLPWRTTHVGAWLIAAAGRKAKLGHRVRCLQIAGFIFGKNTAAGAAGAEKVAMTTPVQLEGGANEKIAMTSPVAAEMSEDGTYKVGGTAESRST